MGKKFKSHQPYKETLDTYKEIEKYIKEENDAKKDKFQFKQKKVKMPYKMYMGIKKSVIKKHQKETEFNQKNDILAQTNKKQKMMTTIILDKLEKQKEEKRNRKLIISRNKNRARFKDGVMNVGKNFKKDKILNDNKSKFNKKK